MATVSVQSLVDRALDGAPVPFGYRQTVERVVTRLQTGLDHGVASLRQAARAAGVSESRVEQALRTAGFTVPDPAPVRQVPAASQAAAVSNDDVVALLREIRDHLRNL